ncbi:MAG: insulinase family protein [Planctomycetaceae bacterium]|nr:MAG: insulinase family protein [Planctomycetaceae bacterium]
MFVAFSAAWLLSVTTASAQSPAASPAPLPTEPVTEVTASAGESPTDATTPEIMKLNDIEGISEYLLPNGTKVLLFPDDSKDVVTVNMTVFVGSRHEGYGEAGMAHLLEHMLFKGTPGHPNIPQALTERGARFNGTTWMDRTNYYETLPATEENLEFAIRLEADRLVNSTILAEDLASEMTVVRNEFERGENSPVQILMQRMQAAAYEWHNYGKSTIGNRSDIERVPITSLRRFYRKHYRPDNVMVIVAGKFDPEVALGMIREYFGSLPQPKEPLEAPYTVEPPKDGERTVVLRRVGDVQYVGAAYHVPASSHPDFAAVRALTYVLSDEPGGRLYKTMVEKQLASNVYALASAFHDPGILMALVEVPQSQSIERARATLIETLEESFATEPVTEQETQRAKQQILKRREIDAADSSQIAVSLSDWAAQGDWRLYFLFRDAIEELTAEQVQAVAQKYLVRNNRTVGLFIPTAQPERVKIPESLDLAARLDGYVGREVMSAGEAFDVSPLAIEERIERGELKPGFSYALLPKKTRGGSVNLSMTLRFGDETSLQGRYAAAELVGMMMQRGTETMTFQEVEDELTRLRADLSISSTSGLVQIRLNTRREYLEDVIGLVREMLRTPRFEAAELEVIRRQVLTSIEASLKEPQALAPQSVRRLLNPYPPEDVRYVPTMEEEMELYGSVTIEQIREFYREFLSGDVGELSVVGDFDPVAVKEEVSQILADWKAERPYARITRPAQPGIAGTVERIETPDKSNAMLYSGLQHELDDETPEFAALEIGNFILGGGTLSSRLADRVRQQEGLSYGIRSGVTSRHRDARTDFTLYAITNPQNVDRLLQVIREEIDLLREKGVTPEELARAKDAFLQAERVRRSDDGSLAALLLGSIYNERTMQFTADHERRVSELTIEQVNQAIRDFIDPERLVMAVAGDFAAAP